MIQLKAGFKFPKNVLIFELSMNGSPDFKSQPTRLGHGPFLVLRYLFHFVDILSYLLSRSYNRRRTKPSRNGDLF